MAFADNKLHILSAGLALLGALLIQIGTNLYNDYADFGKGADTSTRKGPIRVTQAGLIPPARVRAGAFIAFGLAVVAGGYLMWRGGWVIVTIGVLSIFFGFAYTAGKYSLSYLGIADFFVLVFFGPIAVGGTYFVQGLDITKEVLMAGLAPGALAVAILLVNNIRDIVEDEAAGKRTLVVRLGRGGGLFLYLMCIIMACAIPAYFVLASGASPLLLLASITSLVGIILLRRLKNAQTGEEHNALLADTGKLLLAYCLVFSACWIFVNRG